VADLKEYADSHSHRVPTARFGKASWTLENTDDEVLMTKIRTSGIPLRDFTKVEPLYGIKTGFNEAFFIDTLTKERLIREDSQCADIIKPYLRGQDVKRWSPDWSEQWIILLKSSTNTRWAWTDQGENAETKFAITYPSIYKHFKSLENGLRQRHGQGRFWWELSSSGLFFEQPKIVYQVIQFHSAFSYDASGNYTNDKCYFIPKNDLYLLAVLNSPLIWWHNWRYLTHMKDEAYNPAVEKIAGLPIAAPTDAIRAEVESVARRLLELTKTRRDRMHDVLNWLRVEFAVTTPGQKLEAFARLDESAFVDEVKKRRPKTPQLTPAGLRTLTSTFRDYAAQIATLDAESDGLERRVSDLVNVAYGLSAAEIDLMWRTAPPRMPFAR